jgi:thioredoxin
MVDEIKYDETFEAILANSDGEWKHDKRYLIVDFYAPWCGPCKRYAPRFAELAVAYSKHMKFCKIDVDDHDALALKYNITSLPTFMILKVKAGENEEPIVLTVNGIGGTNTIKLEGTIKDLHDSVESSVVTPNDVKETLEEVDTIECKEVCPVDDTEECKSQSNNCSC